MQTGQKYRYKYGYLIIEILEKSEDFLEMSTHKINVLEGNISYTIKEETLLDSTILELFELVEE